MKNFIFSNPTKIIFGDKEIHSLSREIDDNEKILFLYGGGSIKKNGVYNEVNEALTKKKFFEFSGITANPRYEDCMKAIELVKKENISFILAVGGGSVLDAAKFIAAGSQITEDPWDIILGKVRVTKALPIGTVLTLAATGSEMNGNSVISRGEEKRAFYSPLVYPKFSILDPRVLKSLPKRQITNGIVDAFVHVIEQYLTEYQDNVISDRLAEGVLHTLVEIGPKIMSDQNNYNLRANLMWSATMALNGIVGLGSPQDWATHQIGHELTARYGIDHAQSLAIVLPSLLRVQKSVKLKKLVQFGERIFGKSDIEEIIKSLEQFFDSVEMKYKLSEYNIDYQDAIEVVPAKLNSRGAILGEKRDINSAKVKEILTLSK